MAIIWRDVFLVQIAVRCHRVPGPCRVPGDPADVIPVISGTRIVHHSIWAGLEGGNRVTVIQDNGLLIELDPPKIFPRL